MATTTIDTALGVIEARIASQWANTRIRWPNTHYSPPDDISWLAVDIIWGAGTIETKNGRNLITGIVNLNIFVPVGGGDGTLVDLCDDARDMFNRYSSGGVIFDAPSGPRLTTSADNKWRQATVSAAFTTEEVV